MKLHKDLIERLTKQLKDAEQKEQDQWEAQYDPDPNKRLPQHIFEKLNKKVLAEKEEINKALDKAKGSAPKHIDYKDELIKTTEALKALEDADLDAKITNQYLKSIIDRIEYDRPQIVRINKKNAEIFETDVRKGLQYHVAPYTIRVKLKCE